jgi:tetratricopeptide (TPR) repeat protein
MLNRYEDAIRDANTQLTIDPKNAKALNTRAESSRMLNRMEDAIRDATAVLEMDPENTVAQQIKLASSRY